MPVKFSCEFLPVTPDLSALRGFGQICRQGISCDLGAVRILPICFTHEMSTLTVFTCLSHFTCLAPWGINEYLLNRWMCKRMNVAWSTNPGVMIASCFLVSIFCFTVLSQNTPWVPWITLKNYKRVEPGKNV